MLHRGFEDGRDKGKSACWINTERRSESANVPIMSPFRRHPPLAVRTRVSKFFWISQIQSRLRNCCRGRVQAKTAVNVHGILWIQIVFIRDDCAADNVCERGVKMVVHSSCPSAAVPLAAHQSPNGVRRGSRGRCHRDLWEEQLPSFLAIHRKASEQASDLRGHLKDSGCLLAPCPLRRNAFKYWSSANQPRRTGIGPPT